MANILTQEEADELLEMLKKCAVNSFDFPPKRKDGRLESFSIVDESKRFMIIVNRKNLHADDKITYIAIYKKGNIRLLHLDLGTTASHTNPPELGGEELEGPHLHIYRENLDDRYAVPFEVSSSDLIDNFYNFLELFHIIEKPKVNRVEQERL